MDCLSVSGRRMRQQGMTYIGLLIAVAIIAAAATASLAAGTAMQQRYTEAELLAIGLEYRAALQSFANATPAGLPTTPMELAELLEDPRYPGVRRHLRRIYPDPLTGNTNWGIVRGPDGRISGVHSLSRTPTIRHSGFPPGLESLEQAQVHSDWVFSPSLAPQRNR